jgi:sec-independent protein translocase protein TatB
VARTANPSQAEDLFAQSPVIFERRFLMFDFDASKLIIVGIVALIVIGPKELPRVMLQVGQAAAKMRGMAAEFRSQFNGCHARSRNIYSDVERLMEAAKADTGMNPLAQITAELTQAIDSAEKPAMLPSASTRTAIAGPNNAEPLLNSIAGPCLPEAPEEVGLSFSDSGHARTPPRIRQRPAWHISPARRAADCPLMSYNSEPGTNFEVHLSTRCTDGGLD